MTQDDKPVKDLKAKGRNSEKVHRPGDWQVVTQEGQPILRLSASSGQLDHVLPDRVWTGRIVTKQQLACEKVSCSMARESHRAALNSRPYRTQKIFAQDRG